MWFLKSLKNDKQEFCILVGQNYIVGRKDAGILIINDLSISRRHATLRVSHVEENLGDPEKASIFLLKDEGSKYGTFRNGIRLGSDEEVLEEGDSVKFGQFESEYRVSYVPLVVATSCLESSSKRVVKRSVLELGGHLINEWRPSCSHLVMSQIKITVKAMCCLVSAKPIVSPDFFPELIKSYRNVFSIETNKYIPPIAETLVNQVSFDVNPNRRHIFKNKIFFFLDEKQFKKLHLGITIAGGKAVILPEDKVDSNLILQNTACVVQPQKEFTSNNERMVLFKQVFSLLQSNGRRMIPEPDVGLAVAFCSTETFCNPEFNVGSALLGTQKIHSQTFSQQEVYVPDTEKSSLPSLERTRVGKQTCIEETVLSRQLQNSSFDLSTKCVVEDSQENQINNKRKHSEEDPRLPSVSTVRCDQEMKRPRTSYSRLDFTSDLEDENASPSTQNIIPALVKHELDSIFDDLAEARPVQEFDELPPTLPVDSCIKADESNNQRINFNHESNDQGMEVNITGYVEGRDLTNGFPAGNNKLVIPQPATDEDLPRNLVKILVVPLVKKKSVQAQLSSEHDQTTKNFKKFRKVLPVGARALPKIIGAHELRAYDKLVEKSEDDWDVDNPLPEAYSMGEEKGEFDWESQPR